MNPFQQEAVGDAAQLAFERLKGIVSDAEGAFHQGRWHSAIAELVNLKEQADTVKSLLDGVEDE